jgi:hypothetical protein
MLEITPDGSVLNSKGRVLFFSLPRFISDISEGNDCFICGAKQNVVPFNDEHVIPDWILRRYGLHNKFITLPNGTTFRYGAFKIPCCAECNSRMGEEVEKPISEMLASGTKGISQELKDKGPWQLFCWMALIFLKTHLKDKDLVFHRDRRKGDLKIGELHSWEDLHHIHCLARAFYTGCDLGVEVAGSLLVLPAKVRSHFEPFDYCDLSVGQTMLLRMEDIAIIAVFNDSQASLTVFMEDMQKMIGGPLSPLQVREIAVRLASINIQLVERPKFSSELDVISERYKILADGPSEWNLDWHDDVQGGIMHHVCQDLLFNSPEKEQILKDLKTGRYTFLVDGQGKFIENHMELM